ncbi:MAG: glucodextranase DOMON-like domain-containing protein [Candidatus Wallbacteria bacterium]|nr:glucodextranase DOMON-like domain-containing protein [Candidatus Wallbacteria bacterium]
MNRLKKILSVILFFFTLNLYAGDRLYLAILWHQHQPYYYNPATDMFSMPWVRLHSIKDYFDMAKVLEKFPGVEINFNLVPSLLQQIEMYGNGKMDYLMTLHRKKVGNLSDDERFYLIERCFDISWDKVIANFPNYKKLLDRREKLKKSEASRSKLLSAFNRNDLLDLQVWFNLAWFDPCFRESQPLVSSLLKKGERFTFSELQQLLDLELKIMGEIIPLHRTLFQRGQIELVTTPFYHPILPLLHDIRDAKTAMPDTELPDYENADSVACDQVSRAVRFFSSRFGKNPQGMWPAEGSVSYGVLPIFEKNGVNWVATDEKVLAKTIDKYPHRTDGKMENPQDFCTPYQISIGNGKKIAIVFRDTYLSDKIGFDYSGIPAEQAVENFMAYLADIREKTRKEDRNCLVTVILDGENAWENYKNDGHDFLELLYATISKTAWLKTTRISPYIRSNASSLPVLNHLWPGSWINADYSTWIGEPEENNAWKYAFEALRRYRQKSPGLSEEKAEAAYQELLAAFGSDWYWWYGDDQDSGNDSAFDDLFRSHLACFYKTIGEELPSTLKTTLLKPATGISGQSSTMKRSFNEEKTIMESADPASDDYGAGTIVYPNNSVFTKGSFDLRGLKITDSGNDYRFIISYGSLTNPWNSRAGFSVQTTDIYFCGKTGHQDLLPGRGASLKTGGWTYCARIEGWESRLFTEKNGKIEECLILKPELSSSNEITFSISKKTLGDLNGVSLVVTVMGQDGYADENNWRVRQVTAKTDEWKFSGKTDTCESSIIDLLDPDGDQKTQLIPVNGKVELTPLKPAWSINR